MNVENKPVPLFIDLSKVSKILDAAAGTLVWSLEVAQQTDVRKRLHDASHPIRIYACDITLEKFPPSNITDPLHIETFLQDITKPFPNHMLETFDLINMKLLVLALTESGWQKALSNVYRLLSTSFFLAP
jgi:SAM-dependent methyltransferase